MDLILNIVKKGDGKGYSLVDREIGNIIEVWVLFLVLYKIGMVLYICNFNWGDKSVFKWF